MVLNIAHNNVEDIRDLRLLSNLAQLNLSANAVDRLEANLSYYTSYST